MRGSTVTTKEQKGNAIIQVNDYLHCTVKLLIPVCRSLHVS